MNTVELHYSEPLVRRAIWAFWWRTTGWSYLLACALMAIAFCVGLYLGDRSWWVGVSGTVLAAAIGLAASVYFIHLRGSLARFRRMERPVATFAFDDERFRITSDVGTSEMSWNVITAIWCFPEFWLVFFSPSQFMTLPTAALEGATRDFILAKASSARIKTA